MNPARFAAEEAMGKFILSQESTEELSDDDWHGLFLAFLYAVYEKQPMPDNERLIGIMTQLMTHILKKRPTLPEEADAASETLN
jgi:hypothetical protein